VAVGVDVHSLGLLPVIPLGMGGVAPALGGVAAPVLGGAGAPAPVPPTDGIAPPPVLALALETPVSANAAKVGSIRWATRKRSLSSAYGVS
jgi:hypothetical protein